MSSTAISDIAAHAQAPFKWDDPFLLEDELSEEERMIRDAAKAFAEGELMHLPNGSDIYPPPA